MQFRLRVKLYVMVVLAAVSLILACVSKGQGEEVTRVPELRGVPASAPIPPKDHVRNEGGSDRAGLCVISSTMANGLYQGVPGLDVRKRLEDGSPDYRLGQAGKGSAFWRTAKSRPGGYGPDKLIGLVKETLPGEKYASFLNATPDDLERLSKAGYPIGGVMAWGQGYPGRISHMVSVLHYRKDGQACILDNNYPGEYHWMPAREYDARFRANGSWAFIFTRLPVPVLVAFAVAGVAAAVLLALAGAQLVAAAVVMGQAKPAGDVDPLYDSGLDGPQEAL